jgi:hypothetical protein
LLVAWFSSDRWTNAPGRRAGALNREQVLAALRAQAAAQEAHGAIVGVFCLDLTLPS